MPFPVKTMGESKGKSGRKKADTKADDCCSRASESCCSVGAIMSVDSRGQLLLPKELRKKCGIVAGQKMAAICVEKGGRVCCLMLVKAGELNDVVKVRVAPALGELKG